LKDAGLVSERRDGTRHPYRIDPAGLASLRTYLERTWDDALAALAGAAWTDEGGPVTGSDEEEER
jgi:DNA-binding transcriptional ArsR family regulator